VIILKSDLSDNIIAIYNKTKQEPFVIINININDAELIKKIEGLSNKKGIIYRR
jgi:ribosomal protein L7Ae-like RNA K-turn-binding protein